MRNTITLEEIYLLICREYSGFNHNPQTFQSNLLFTLNDDPIRTSGIRRQIENEGLEYQLSRDFPLSEILRGSVQYLKDIGVPSQKAEECNKKIDKKKLFVEPSD